MVSLVRLGVLVITLAIVAGLSDATCRRMALNSWGFRYHTAAVSGAAVVTSISVLTVYSHSPCTLGTSFGSYGPLVWITAGCRGSFNVCYVPGANRELTCSSRNFGPKWCNVPPNVRSVAIKEHKSSSPCVQDFSFSVEDLEVSVQGSRTNLVVRNGCRARFVVGHLR